MSMAPHDKINTGPRKLRAVTVITQDHRCAFCGGHAEQFHLAEGQSLAACGPCATILRDCPRTWTLAERSHYCATMRLRRQPLTAMTVTPVRKRKPIQAKPPDPPTGLRAKLAARRAEERSK